MNTSKAEEAVDKSEEHKNKSSHDKSLEGEMNTATMQPSDGYINPYGRIGTVPPTSYSLTNQLDGTNTQSIINPET